MHNNLIHFEYSIFSNDLDLSTDNNGINTT